ncbi:SRPBCC family protein [Paraburkholderia sp. MMS20-SJTR3]|uniref:SRPBCC family protein n=1 Tax=Paraburkholderia sejongensis TaxID=2886946 RepID=A0ABS8JV84_9BURK|nr:SRPBCC family protein [Paraburkholderia sp. MMS20-SJTR3]MCC8393799.1 SRPBCC family protein [Paraburkholderia sp. MMS20-SJTR3]
MEIEQSFTVPYPRDAVWARFHDTSEIVACLPGASLTAPVDNGMLKLAMTVKLGPIVASFAGDGEMKLDDAQYRGSITGTGVDRKSSSRVKGVAAFALEATAASQTRVDVKVDYTIGGSLAQFSRGGIVKELATRMTEAFAENLKAKLDAAGAASNSAQAQAAAMAVAQEAEGSAAPVAPAAQTRVEARPAARAPSANGASASNAANATNAPLDVGNLFWKMLWSRLRGLFSFAAR